MALKDRLYDVPVVGTALRVQDRYVTDAGDQFAGAIGFFGFLSLFPLILLALSAAGYVLADASGDRINEVAQTIQDAIPGFAAAMGGGEDATGVGQALQTIIENKEAAGGFGALLLLLSGLRVVNAAQTATLVIFRVDRSEMVGVKQKAKQVAALVGLGLLALAGAAAGSAIGVVSSIELFGAMAVGGSVGAVATVFLGDEASRWWAAHKTVRSRPKPTSWIDRMAARFGAPGLGLLAPVVVGTPAGAMIGIGLGLERKALLGWLLAGTVLWSAVLAGVTAAGVSVAG